MGESKLPKPAPDWERIETEYRVGILSLREIATPNGVTEGAIRKRAKRDAWERDLGAKACAKKVKDAVQLDALDGAGFVYVIYIEDTSRERFYKIGMSGTFTSRVMDHQCASPFTICVACAYFVGNMRLEERELHARFAGLNVRGEWFRLSDADLTEIAQRALLV